LGRRRVAIGIETSRSPVISALLTYDFIVFLPINPKALKDYQSAFAVSGVKDDRTDAMLLEEFARLHGDKLRALEPDTRLTRQLGGLTENRRFPDALAESAPPSKRRRSKRSALSFTSTTAGGPKKMEARLAAVKQARALTEDAAILIPARHLVSARADMLKALHSAIADLDKAIAPAFDQHPDAALFRSLPGAGPALAPRLLVAFGTRRDRFASASEVAQFYGLAPIVKQNGHTKTTHMRSRCPQFARQTFHENASCVFKAELWAKRYYEDQKGKPEGQPHQDVRALAGKLIRIYYACWKHRRPYDRQCYLQALEKQRQPTPQQTPNLLPQIR
jgi:hypothetical protein